MKMRIIFLSICFLLISNVSFSQKKNDAKSIISSKVAIKKYHYKDELENMQKGELLSLYMERIDILIKTLPYIAFARMPGVTMADLGIPDTNDNNKALQNQFDATDSFLKTTIEFQEKMLPYSDKRNLVAAILFYEETMKSLYIYSEFN
ncbi:hypothetical protein ACFQ0I_09860 [Mariniflexile aquimaris]|uniref:Uncharacterized protein n=1 Tax=Mariniflexile aquimaris TaxID=881009 RepID=A0ABW3BSD7_9FLAO